MIDPEPITYSGRSFSGEELSLIQQATRDCAGLGVTEIARTICEWLDWKRPNGQLKNHECRLLLERLQRERFLTLPPLRPSGRRGPRQVSTDVDTPPVIQATIAQLEPLLLTLVDTSDSRLWRQFIERFHYLVCRLLLEKKKRIRGDAGDVIVHSSLVPIPLSRTLRSWPHRRCT